MTTAEESAEEDEEKKDEEEKESAQEEEEYVGKKPARALKRSASTDVQFSQEKGPGRESSTGKC